MKIRFYLLILTLFFIFSCTNEDRLTFKTTTFKSEKCTDCTKVKISIPISPDETRISETINNALKEEIIFLLTFEEDIDISSIKKAITSFKNGYLEQKDKYPDEVIGWEAKINGEVTYEDKYIITIRIKSYLFTGGAHGYTSIRFLNFDKKKGVELENWEVFENKANFINFVETKFRIQEGIPQGKPINSTGFMFENDEFHLPKNLGFTKKGLQLLYNQYEVASYTDGPITITIPSNEVNTYLSTKIKS